MLTVRMLTTLQNTSLKANYNNASSNPASYVAVFNGSKMLILLFFF